MRIYGGNAFQGMGVTGTVMKVLETNTIDEIREVKGSQTVKGPLAKLRTSAFTESEMGSCWKMGASGYHDMPCCKRTAGAAGLRISEGQGEGPVKKLQ